jgi:PPK2 family polyphosphate:nucleotide phosphotransferase
MKPANLVRRFRIDDPDRFRLASMDCADTCGLDLDKDDAKAMLAEDAERLAKLQEKLYAQDRWALLVVLQGMDTAGKDGVIKHVMNGINPQGCEVHPFKAPSADELDHDFLWRAAIRLPARGDINIFNRSYYEEVLVVRVHPEMLARQKLPEKRIGKDVWNERFEDIRGFERHVARSGTAVLKFFLHISKEEQRRRLLDRLDEPAKRWKFAVGDIAERKLWDKYMAAYEDMVRATSRPWAPWYVVPADNKWFARLVVARAIIETLEGLGLALPEVDTAARAEMKKVRAALIAEGGDEPTKAAIRRAKRGGSAKRVKPPVL